MFYDTLNATELHLIIISLYWHLVKSIKSNIMKLSLYKPDILGAVTSSLCIIHCLTTPLIFIVQANAVDHHHSSPFWWKNIDYILLAISLFAVYKSTRMTTSKFIKPSLWISWSLLFLLILNEKLEFLLIAETVTYLIAFTLAALHIYNFKYCQCEEDKCCSQNE